MFAKLRLRHAAKHYARSLPPALRRGWGVCKHYTPAQIRRAAENAGLDLRYIALGYAAFLPVETFDALRPDMPVALSYEDARSAFLRHRPAAASSGGWEIAAENIDAVGSTDAWPTN